MGGRVDIDDTKAHDFSSLGLRSDLLENVASLGYATMTPIQAQSLPHVLKGEDVIGQGKTGSGKTAVFGLGIMNRLVVENQQGRIGGFHSFQRANQLREGRQVVSGKESRIRTDPLEGSRMEIRTRSASEPVRRFDGGVDLLAQQQRG